VRPARETIAGERDEEEPMDEARLQGIPLFAGLGKSERRLVARTADEVELEPGDPLCREGELAWEFLVIEEGSAKVMRGDQYVNEVGPGDFVGEIGLIEGTARNATVTAQSPIRAIVMTGHAFRRICNEMPQVGERIRAAIEERRHWLEPVS
jgi:CRP/FNR family transcriptional regulator, cyclic AMP receptor protein